MAGDTHGPARGGRRPGRLPRHATVNALNLTSNGEHVIFAVYDGVLIGYVDGTVFGFPTPGYLPGVDRTVMSLELDKATGSFNAGVTSSSSDQKSRRPVI